MKEQTSTTSAAHGLSRGDRIHIDGRTWTVVSVTATTFTIRRSWWRRTLDAIGAFARGLWDGLRALCPWGDA